MHLGVSNVLILQKLVILNNLLSWAFSFVASLGILGHISARMIGDIIQKWKKRSGEILGLE